MKEQKAKILIVDDESLIIQGLRRILMIHGYQPLTTTKPKIAIEIMKSNAVDILICDQRMPDMSGNEVLQFAKMQVPDIVSILLTGYSDLNSTIEAINNGLIFRYLPKPVEEKELIQAIEEAYAHRNDKIEKDRILHSMSIEREALKKMLNELNAVIGNHKHGAIKALLKTVKVKDPELYDHSIRVETHVRKIALHLGYSNERIENLALAGLFHDLGKLTIRDYILYNEGPLDSEDFDQMKEHVIFGTEIVKELGFVDKAADIVLEHHERLDGSGYPYGRKGNEISQEGRILAIADVYDALVNERVYHKAMSKDEALHTLRKDENTKLDGYILDALQAIVS